MSTKSRAIIWGGRIMGAENSRPGRAAAQTANREADRAEAKAWSVRMEGYGRARPAASDDRTMPQRRSVECNRCKTRASLPLDAIRRPRDTPIWKLEASLKCTSCRKSVGATGAHDQADRNLRSTGVQRGHATAHQRGGRIAQSRRSG